MKIVSISFRIFEKPIITLILLCRFFYFDIFDFVSNIQRKKLSFRKTGEIIGSGHNNKIVIEDSRRRKWIAKFCKNTAGRCPSICEREELGFKFARLLGLPVVPTYVVDSKRIKDASILGGNFIKGKCVLIKYVSEKNLKEALSENGAGTNKLLLVRRQDIINSAIFYHWYGDEDRGLEDILVYRKTIVFIDHGLCGPGHDERLRGAHPYPRAFVDEADIVKKCYPGKPSFYEYCFKTLKIFEYSENMQLIRKIKSMPNFLIRYLVREYYIVDPSGNVFNERFADILVERKKMLASDFSVWSKRFVQVLSFEKEKEKVVDYPLAHPDVAKC